MVFNAFNCLLIKMLNCLHEFLFSKEDVEITSEDIPGWAVASENSLTVALDIHLNETLRQEGIARDLVNRIQNQRKDMGLDVQDRINIRLDSEESFVRDAIVRFDQYIKQETQADRIDLTSLQEAMQVELDEYIVAVEITKSN
jgi:isoleucyl-tRNA synthetase